jgi:hypothetical protein
VHDLRQTYHRLKIVLGDMDLVESHFFSFGDMLVSVQDRCTVCAMHTIGLEIILDARDGSPW